MGRWSATLLPVKSWNRGWGAPGTGQRDQWKSAALNCASVDITCTSLHSTGPVLPVRTWPVLRRCAVLPRRTTVLHQYLRIVLPARIPVLHLCTSTELSCQGGLLYFNHTSTILQLYLLAVLPRRISGHHLRPPAPCLWSLGPTSFTLGCIALHQLVFHCIACISLHCSASDCIALHFTFACALHLF